ncbi:conjugal transfer protein TraD [Methyloceanibacter sp.]|uniref:conjugal transfer protein TraD n=1 Tax=Methyloceanibacter sp. TaxID=1965321 RepID=UPI002CC38C8A|nr:conjugal transfer protein TraD [Methyloceanibacter sp.]HML91731.1 conjugal transfer protein TraD [Methyloceanibacter sp.]
MRAWQIERRKRTRHLIELGGLVVKAGIVDLTGDDRAMIYGALIWIADKLNSEDGEHARGVWTRLGTVALKKTAKNAQAPERDTTSLR